MYIPEFVCGFIVGAVVGVTALIIVALWFEQKKGERS